MLSRTMKEFESITTTYIYDGLEGILDGNSVGGAQQQSFPESISWSYGG
jgi:hypothetical protein